MSNALDVQSLGKKFGRNWALQDCTLAIPIGRVSALVGPNGAGKSTLLNLAAGLLSPTSGDITVLGEQPGQSPKQLARVGFVSQNAATYSAFTVSDHLRLGAHLNPRWDAALASRRVATLGLDLDQRAGRLSGGQRAQLALTLAISKRPELLLLDEPLANLDPLARRDFLRSLMDYVVEDGVSVVLSSHLIADLERVCDHIVVLVASKAVLCGDVDEVLVTHKRITGPRRDPRSMPSSQDVIQADHTDRQTTMILRTKEPIHDPSWAVEPVGLEDVVLAYMGSTAYRDSAPSEGDGPVNLVRT